MHKKHFVYAVLLYFNVALCLVGAADKPSAISSVKAYYQKSLDKLSSDSFAYHIQWSNHYKNALKAHQAERQKEGDLDGWRVAKAELDRFVSDQDLDENTVAASPAAIGALQKKYLKLREDMLTKKNNDIVKLTEKYTAHLLAKQTSYTKAGDMENAISFNNELKRVKQEEKYLAAKEALAPPVEAFEAAEAPDDFAERVERQAPSVAVSTTGRVLHQERPVDLAVAPAPPPAPISVPSRFRIYKQSDRSAASMSKGLAYKPLTLRSTGKASSAAGMACSAQMCKASSSNKSSIYYTSSTTTANTRALKLTARITRSSMTFSDLTVIVQYFAKAVGKSGESQFDSHLIPLKSLEKEPMIIECPSFSLSKRRDAYYGKSGSDFYGVLVSVFDSDMKTLLYQGVSASGLKDYADTAFTQCNMQLAKQQVDALYATYNAIRAAGSSGGSYSYEQYNAAREAYYRARDVYNRNFPNTPYSSHSSSY